MDLPEQQPAGHPGLERRSGARAAARSPPPTSLERQPRPPGPPPASASTAPTAAATRSRPRSRSTAPPATARPANQPPTVDHLGRAGRRRSPRPADVPLDRHRERRRTGTDQQGRVLPRRPAARHRHHRAVRVHAGRTSPAAQLHRRRPRRTTTPAAISTADATPVTVGRRHRPGDRRHARPRSPCPRAAPPPFNARSSARRPRANVAGHARRAPATPTSPSRRRVTLTFTRPTGTPAQTVTVAAAEDADTAGGTATITATAHRLHSARRHRHRDRRRQLRRGQRLRPAVPRRSTTRSRTRPTATSSPEGVPVPLGRDADRRGARPGPRDHLRGVQLLAVAGGAVRPGHRRLGTVQQRLGDDGEVHHPDARRPADQRRLQRRRARPRTRRSATSPASTRRSCNSSVPVGADPIAAELKTTYGTGDIYGMHWLHGRRQHLRLRPLRRRHRPKAGRTSTPSSAARRSRCGRPSRSRPATRSSTAARTATSTCSSRTPRYAKQWKYTNAPDADARAIQAAYWALTWAKAQGKQRRRRGHRRPRPRRWATTCGTRCTTSTSRRPELRGDRAAPAGTGKDSVALPAVLVLRLGRRDRHQRRLVLADRLQPQPLRLPEPARGLGAVQRDRR